MAPNLGLRTKFDYSTTLFGHANKRPYDPNFGQHGPNLRPKTIQKSTPNRSNIDAKNRSNSDRFFVDSLAPRAVAVDPCFATKLLSPLVAFPFLALQFLAGVRGPMAGPGLGWPRAHGRRFAPSTDSASRCQRTALRAVIRHSGPLHRYSNCFFHKIRGFESLGIRNMIKLDALKAWRAKNYIK